MTEEAAEFLTGEKEGEERGWQIVPYSEGYFLPSGEKGKNPFSSAELEIWGQYTARYPHIWGEGQMMKMPGGKDWLTLGRSRDDVDIYVSASPGRGAELIERDGTVSRGHLALRPPDSNGMMGVRDLHSSNGTKIISNGEETVLKGKLRNGVLKEGDTLIIGEKTGINYARFDKERGVAELVKFKVAREEPKTSQTRASKLARKGWFPFPR